MLVDMHLHEKTWSTDSFISLEEIVRVARDKGLDAVCITDHDSMGLKEYAEEYARRVNFPIFVGVEYYSLWGDITAWGIDSFPGERIEAQRFLDAVNRAEGFCVSCHPFRNNKRGFEDNLRLARGLHGVEVFNGSADAQANDTAARYARELGLQPIGASDAHTLEQIGKYATWLPNRVTTLRDFVCQLRTCPVKPAVWTGSGYEIREL